MAGDRAGKPTLRLVMPQETPSARVMPIANADEPVAEVRGINLHAKQAVDGRDRNQLERLCRYITRPPVAQDRLARLPDGRIELTLKRAWRDGTRALVFEPHDLITRLVAAIPPPRSHLVRYFGVLSSHASLRAEVVPKPPPDPARHKPPPARGDQLELLGEKDDKSSARNRWAWLLAHVFAADLDTCPRCSGPMRWADVATTRDAVARLLAAHGLGPRASSRKCTAPPRLSASSACRSERHSFSVGSGGRVCARRSARDVRVAHGPNAV